MSLLHNYRGSGGRGQSRAPAGVPEPGPAVVRGVLARRSVAECRGCRPFGHHRRTGGPAVQDTTTPDHDGLSATRGLDAPGGGGRGTSGILVHVGIAVNAVGRPLGMFDADFRQAEGSDSVRRTDGLDRALAAACPDTRVVGVCDREGDFRELRDRARRTGAELLVRAGRGARRRVATGISGSAFPGRTRSGAGRSRSRPAAAGTTGRGAPRRRCCAAWRRTCFPRRTGPAIRRSA